MATRKKAPVFSGDNLRQIRERKALSQQDLADMIGRTKSSISRYETGENVPDANVVWQLSGALRCQILRLYA